jgi:hypothetical protein
MSRQNYFMRNLAARDLLDIFVVSAASSIVLLRFYLYLTGYPTIGGTKYHIAHMLWGGLLMAAAFVLNFAFLGARLQKLVALLGGIGFGIFIDEIGKYVTRDNNYFFHPAVGMIYAIFVALYLTITFLTREQPLTSQEYQLNALRYLEEAVHNDMDIHERAATRALLTRANQQDVLTKRLHALLRELPVAPASRPGSLRRARHRVAALYDRLWQKRGSSAVVRWFFVLETLMFFMAVVIAVYSNVDSIRDFFLGRSDYGHSLVVGQLVSTVVAGIFVLVGLRWLAGSRVRAFEWFRRATLVNLLLTEFFIFSRVQFGAMPSFAFNLILLMVINVVIDQELRHTEKT